jgi:hypothetical protein
LGTLGTRFGGIKPGADLDANTWTAAIRKARSNGVAPLSKDRSLDKEGQREPARCVSLFVSARKDDLPRSERSFRLMASGYAMDNMKALAFLEAETPEITVPEAADVVAAKARDLVAATNVIARALGQAVKTALYGHDADIGVNTTPITTARDRFWADTNDSFFATLNDLSVQPVEQLAGEGAMRLAQTWRGVVERAALAIFDDVAPVQDALSHNIKRVVAGRRLLVRTLLGFDKRGIEFFKDLQLPVPDKTSRGKAA